jgi:methionyl-tRNA formyltransferase
MKKMSETIVFFGSGPVAAKSLAYLAKAFHIEAVITKAAPKHHRGAVPVVDTAAQFNLKTFFAATKAEVDDVLETTRFASELGILVDYGVIISDKAINAFRLGIINSHFSLLPEWRGADPITFSILSGQQTTGVSLMLVVEALDEGPLLAQQAITINKYATTPLLTEQLISISNEMLGTYIPQYVVGAVTPYPQPLKPAPSYSRRLTKQDGSINWTKPASVLAREVRAFIEWPKSYTAISGKDVTVKAAHAEPGDGLSSEPAGTATVRNRHEIWVRCGSGFLVIDRLQPAGKPEMDARAFLAGYGQMLARL